VERGPDGTLRFRRPDGSALPDVCAPPRVPADPVGALRAGNAAAGVTPDARTAKPEWGGEPLDVGYALDVLRPDNGVRPVPPSPRAPVSVAPPDAAAPTPDSAAAVLADGWAMEPFGMEMRWRWR
jgi:hypothetical protein